MFVSVIIPTFHDWCRLKNCLLALENQAYPNSKFEVIIVNNDPSDLPPKDLSLEKNVTLISESRSGSYAARNAGLKIAKGDILGFTDSDCIPDKNWIGNAVAVFNKSPEVLRIGGKIEIFSTNVKIKNVELYDFLFAFPQAHYCKAGFAVTGNMFSRKNVFLEIGLFNENLKSGGDSEWGRRAQKKGCTIVYGETVLVNHPARDTLKELKKKAKRVGEGLTNFEGVRNISTFKWLKYMFGSAIPKSSKFKEIRKQLPLVSFSSAIYVWILFYYIRFEQNRAIFKNRRRTN